MKRFFKGLVIVFVFGMVLAMVPEIDSYAATKKSKSKVTYTFKKGVLTIKGKGKMPKNITFKKNKKIKKVVIKKGVTSISYKAFYKCKNLKEVKIANTVKQIGAFSFSETKIKKITIPKSVKVIGDGVLEDCDKLTEVTMPGDFKLKSVLLGTTSNIMYGCDKLKRVNFNTNFNVEIANRYGGIKWNVRKKDPNYKSINGVIYTKDGKEIVRVPRELKVLKVANGCETFRIQSIFYTADYYDAGDLYPHCYALEKIILPKSIKKIDNKERIGDFIKEDKIDMNLQEVVVKSKQLDADSVITLVSCLKQIGNWKNKYAFEDMEIFVEMFPERIKKNGDFYILDDTILLGYEGKSEIVTIPTGIKLIADKAFERKKCTKVILPEGLERIGKRTFNKCKKLVEINLPKTLKEIGYESFAYTKIKKIETPSNITKWGERLFVESSLCEVVLPNEIAVIPKGIFSYARKLTKINVPNGLQKIEERAFLCTNVDVQSFLNNDGLRIIEANAFWGVPWTEISIPEYIESIDSGAFDSFDNKSVNVTIEGEKTKYSKNVFLGCINSAVLNFKSNPSTYFTELFVETERGNLKTATSETTIKWLKVKGVDGYDIVISSNKKFSKNVTKLTAKKNKNKLLIDVSRKWKYAYVKIRPFKMVDGKKVCGKWATDFDNVY